MRCWILIADAARARVFSSTGRRKPLHLEWTAQNPWGRARPQDIVTDDPGRYSGGGRNGMPSTWGPSLTPDMVEEKRFAHQLAERLEGALARREYDAVAMFAPAQFLGLLRGSIDRQVRSRVVTSVAKDLAAVSERELPKYLDPVLWRPA